jgi:hypothetical protein
LARIIHDGSAPSEGPEGLPSVGLGRHDALRVEHLHQALDPSFGKVHHADMATMKLHHDGRLELPTGPLRALGTQTGGTVEVTPRAGGGAVLRAKGGDQPGLP